MRPLSAIFLAVFWVSAFAETAMLAPGGLAGVLLLASFSAFLPGLLDALVEPVAFRPDVAIAVDPLAPEARTLAAGAQAAMRHVASTGAPVRVLLARAPGFDLIVDLNAVRRRAFAEIRRAGSAEVVSASQAALPAFTCGDETARIAAVDSGDNARVVVLPPASGTPRLRVCPHRLDARPATLAETALFVLAVASGGWTLAMAAVAIPGGCALAARFCGTARKQGLHPRRWTLGAVALHVAAGVAIVANFSRVAIG